MADSCPSLDVNPDRPCHQLEPGTRQHCFSTPAHSSYHTSNHLCPGLSLCPVLTARLVAITAPSIRNLGQRSTGSLTHTTSGPTADNHQSYPTDAEFHASLQTLSSSPDHVPLAFPLTRLRLSACLRRIPSISRVKSPPETPAPPST